MSQELATWERELWSRLSSGDGDGCPMRDTCNVKHAGGWCFDDHRQGRRTLSGAVLLMSSADKREGAICPNIDPLPPKRWAPKPIFALVEMLANKCLKRVGFGRPPISIDISMLLDTDSAVEIRYIPLKAHHGALWYVESRWVVQLNANESPTRQRFTLFHEFFHILAHRQTTPIFRVSGSTGGSFNEILADHFAGCLLMPRKRIKEEWAGVHDVSHMAAIFDVTRIAMRTRLKILGLEQVSINV